MIISFNWFITVQVDLTSYQPRTIKRRTFLDTLPGAQAPTESRSCTVPTEYPTHEHAYPYKMYYIDHDNVWNNNVIQFYLYGKALCIQCIRVIVNTMAVVWSMVHTRARARASELACHVLEIQVADCSGGPESFPSCEYVKGRRRRRPHIL